MQANGHRALDATGPFRKANVSITLSEFEIPPMQDVLLVGKRSPIGPSAVKMMVEAVSPDQYEIVQLGDHEIFEAVVIRRSILQLIPAEKLLKIIMEEGSRIANDASVIKAQLAISIQVNRVVDL